MRIVILALSVLLGSTAISAEPTVDPKGSVTLEIAVSSDGTVTDAKVLSTDLPPEYSEKALAQAKAYKYKPKLKNGKPVPSKGIQVIRFGE